MWTLLLYPWFAAWPREWNWLVVISKCDVSNILNITSSGACPFLLWDYDEQKLRLASCGWEIKWKELPDIHDIPKPPAENPEHEDYETSHRILKKNKCMLF